MVEPQSRALLAAREEDVMTVRICGLAAVAAAAAAPLLLLSPPASRAAAAPCLSVADEIAKAPKFSDYPVPPPRPFKPARPDTNPRDAHQFRSALGEAAKQGPNFAGRYTIAGWGCGTSCLDWGVIDARTGKVTFDKARRVVLDLASEWKSNDDAIARYHAQGSDADFDLLAFRKDSALLVVLGAPGEDEARAGLTWLRWTGRRFEQVRFTPQSALCVGD